MVANYRINSGNDSLQSRRRTYQITTWKKFGWKKPRSADSQDVFQVTTEFSRLILHDETNESEKSIAGDTQNDVDGNTISVDFPGGKSSTGCTAF